MFRSPAMIEPMLDANSRSRPTWRTWRAHVRFLRFCLRYTYIADDDEVTLERLVNEFLELFTSTYPDNYYKPKHHMIEHLKKYLRLYGPFRHMWTLPHEAFLLHLKQLCQASNYKTVPFTVLRNWALGRALTLASGESSSCLSLELQPASDFMLGERLQAAVSASPLLHALSAAVDHVGMLEARYLHFVSRDGVEARCGDWLLLASGGRQMIACVQEMAEVVLPSGPRIRLWCNHRSSLKDVTEDTDGMIRLEKHDADSTAACHVLVRLDMVCVTQLECKDRGGHREFRYV